MVRNSLALMLDYQTLIDDNGNSPIWEKYPDEVTCMKNLKECSNALIDDFDRIKDGEVLKKMHEIRI